MKHIALLLILLSGIYFHSINSKKLMTGACLVETTMNRNVIEIFLSDPFFTDIRSTKGLSHLSVHDISVLSDTTSACLYFRTDFEEEIDAIVPNTNFKKFDLTMYNVQDHFFIVRTVHQSTDSSYIAMGLSLIYVFDDQLEYVDGFSF